MAERVVAYAREALEELAPERCATFEESLCAAQYAAQLEPLVPLAEGVTDAGFANKANARDALARGVQDLVFVAPHHKTLPELIQQTRLSKRLRNWRAGMEGTISAKKRAFGLDRCTWSGYESFQAYVHLAVLAFNLQTLARHLLA